MVIDGQICLFNAYKTRTGGCGDCICQSCLYGVSGRCKYGSCYDDHRAVVFPYFGTLRKGWSDWDKPGEHEHWCRGGTFYPQYECSEYVAYDSGATAFKTCLQCSIVQYQDGYIQCPLVDVMGCEECYKRFEDEAE